jgi:phenylpropionate dioxygenase-like ring-hydroxylating dioxygenase large terminal subunit
MLEQVNGNGTSGSHDWNALVRAEEGLVSRRIFSEPDVYELEMQKIFARCWLFLCHESQLKKPGDFFSTYMGEDPVLVTRAKDGKIGAYLNSCRHRGMKVCRADEGNADAFTCSYHAWTYASDGKLIGIPNYKEAYYEELNKDQWGLIRVPRLESYCGLVFGCWDPDAVTLTEYLGDFTYYLDLMFNRRAGGTEVLGDVHKWQMTCNWKFAADNFVGDLYHTQYSHGSAMPRAQVDSMQNAMQVSPGNGHGIGIRLRDDSDPLGQPSRDPLVMDYLESIRPEVEERLGKERANTLWPIHSTLFPNFTFGGNGLMRVWMPRGPGHMEIWSWVCVDRDAPDDVKQAFLKHCQFAFNVSGMFEQDDGENWHQCTEASRGYIARQHEFNYQMGLGHEETMEVHPGRRGGAYAELNQRGFYKRYRELISR